MICLLCEPLHLRIDPPINSFHLAARDDPPDIEAAVGQHRGLVAALEALDVRPLLVPPLPRAPYQVFMRDVLIGGLDEPVLASMREPVRRQELAELVTTLDSARIPFTHSEGGHLEGGDVVVNGRDVYVGLSDRTEGGAVEWLRGRFPRHRFTVLAMKPGFLHLDMVFNVFSSDSCVFCPEALDSEAAALLRRRFGRCLEIDREEQRRMSTNFLPVGDFGAVVPRSAIDAVPSAAEAAGRRVIRVDLSEIQKGGGSVRCSTCLLEDFA